ncbi:transposase [Streptomyces sp. NPDC001177]
MGDAGAFPTAAHLASYAGLTPTTRRSETSVRGEGPPRGGNQDAQTGPVPGFAAASTSSA